MAASSLCRAKGRLLFLKIDVKRNFRRGRVDDPAAPDGNEIPTRKNISRRGAGATADSFSRRSPVANVIFFACVTALTALFSHPLFIGISFAAAFSYSVKLKGTKALKTFFLGLFPLWCFIVLINSFASGRGETVFYIFPNGPCVSLEAAAYGAATATIAVSLIIWFICWNEVVTGDEFVDVFGGAAPGAALLALTTLRFAPLYARRLEETLSARRAAGLSKGGGKINYLKDAGDALLGTVRLSLERGIETSDSMKARGYGLKGRTERSRRAFSPADAASTALAAAGAAASLVCKLSGRAEAAYEPTIEISAASPFVVVSAAAHALLCFLPLLYDLAEDIRWRRLYAKI